MFFAPPPEGRESCPTVVLGVEDPARERRCDTHARSEVGDELEAQLNSSAMRNLLRASTLAPIALFSAVAGGCADVDGDAAFEAGDEGEPAFVAPLGVRARPLYDLAGPLKDSWFAHSAAEPRRFEAAL